MMEHILEHKFNAPETVFGKDSVQGIGMILFKIWFHVSQFHLAILLQKIANGLS